MGQIETHSSHFKVLDITHPRQRQPAGAEARNVREEPDSGSLCSGRGAGNQAREDEDHAQTLAHGAPEEELSAPHALDDEPGYGGEDGVDDHVDAAEEEGYVVRLVDRRLEQDREVVDDRIAASNLLHELAAHTQHHPAEMLRLPAGEDGLERRALAPRVAGSADAVHDDALLQLRFLVVALEPPQRRDDRLAFLVAFAGEEPARGLGEPDHAQDEDEGEDGLEGDGEAPREVRGAVAGAVVDPVSDQGPEGDDAAFDADEEAAVARA